ncbi:MAG: hypothetical protein NT158_01645 [Cyanobacteria bacterium]|nr:hypothetical protein [Cyanobacteriota bacterium]
MFAESAVLGAVFPTGAPYRIDQVMAAPGAMAVLFLGQVLAAALLSRWAVSGGGRRLWGRAIAGLLLAQVALFFTLASWGTSDITKLSHFLSFDRSAIKGEPFWLLVSPLIVALPFRMATVHGLVAAGYGAAALLLARHWRAWSWAGWWVLLICCSPLLRGFMQNSHSRQALSTLLLLPVLLWAGRMARVPRPMLVVLPLWGLTCHTTALFTLLLALLPRLPGMATWPAGSVRWFQNPWRAAPWRVLALALGGLIVVGVLAGHWAWELVPMLRSKLDSYWSQQGYANSYPLAAAVGRLQLAMAIGVVLTCQQRHVGPARFLACDRSRQLVLYSLVYGLVEGALALGLVPQITSRLADPAGFFLLIVWLAWLEHYRCLWAALPALLVTLDYWLVERLAGSQTLHCGSNDTFFCVPDRWPWQVRY